MYIIWLEVFPSFIMSCKMFSSNVFQGKTSLARTCLVGKCCKFCSYGSFATTGTSTGKLVFSMASPHHLFQFSPKDLHNQICAACLRIYDVCVLPWVTEEKTPKELSSFAVVVVWLVILSYKKLKSWNWQSTRFVANIHMSQTLEPVVSFLYPAPVL